MAVRKFVCRVALFASLLLHLGAQTATDMAALKGLAPVTILSNTQAGEAALGANFVVTGGIQTGAIEQPTLLPFREQQQQALRDVFITGGNLAQLADGLGTTLGAAYVARAHYIDRQNFTSVSQAVADVIAYANATSGADSNSGKYFFGNATTDGTKPVSAEAMAILKTSGGSADPFGRAMDARRGPRARINMETHRPFRTEPGLTPITGPDYFNTPADNTSTTAVR